MKNLKTSMTALAVGLLFSIGAKAQVQEEKKLTNEQKKEIVENMKVNVERLALTDAQKEPFKEITKKYAEKAKAIKAGDETKIEKLKAAKALKEEKNAEMKTLLSESQYNTYLEIQNERKQKLLENRKK
ncbi:hypothetical protein [Flavobacterium sp. 3HN19-14]|uniref:hypothetical protein n=1 Tax=Flavobacterium sp. 3HN19-14 TaxID=3448133 RepID=UPI003EE39466